MILKYVKITKIAQNVCICNPKIIVYKFDKDLIGKKCI